MAKWRSGPQINPCFWAEDSSRHNPSEDKMHRCLRVLAALTMGLLASFPGNVQPLRAGEPNPVTAIDIMLEPDATMIEHAKAFSHHVFAAVR